MAEIPPLKKGGNMGESIKGPGRGNLWGRRKSVGGCKKISARFARFPFCHVPSQNDRLESRLVMTILLCHSCLVLTSIYFDWPTY